MTYARAQAAGELPPLTVKQPPAETPPVEPPIAAEPPPEQPPPVVAGPPPEPAYGPLAQYGPSFRAPHRASTTNIEGARIYTRARAVLVQQGMADQWKTNKYTLWMRGQIANNPELFHMDHLDQARWFATQDIYENFVLPMSGKLDPQLALDGGKRPDEFYVRTRPSAAFPKDVKIGAAYFGDLTNQEKDAIDRAQYDYVTKDLQDSMRIQKGETDGAWAARMEQAGIRRISGDVARIWQRDTRPTSVLRRVFLRNGLNQIWRFFLLGIKPAWSAWNSMTNESLLAFRYLFTKGGGTAFFNSMVDTYGVAKAADLIKRQILHNSDGIGLVNMRQLMQSDPRLAELFAGSLGEQFNRQLQHVGALSDQWNRSIAKRTVRLLAPYSTDFAPVRLLRGFAEANYRFNIHAENAARAGAAVAEISQVTGKMVRTVEDLQQAMKTMSEADFDTVRHGVLDALGNYSQLGSMEREWIVTIAPFYPWFKTIMGITAKWVTRHPERLWVLGVMGSAFMTAQNQDYQVGVPLPGFASEAIPAGKPRGGVQPIIQPQGINPLATPLDIINTARSLAGDPNAQPSDLGLALLGPAAQFAYVALTNRDPFFGGTYAGPGAGLPAPFRGLGSLFETPQYRAIQEHGGIPGLIPPYKSKVYIMPGGSSSIPGLSNADMLAIEQYWGVPLRYGDLENLRTRGLSEQGKGVSTQAPAAPPAYHSPTQATSGAYSGWGG
jgi:hypothetical protein